MPSARTSMRAPRTTKKSGTKNPCATPVTWRESRFGPPVAATTRPTAKPAIRMLVPIRVASQQRREEHEQRHPEVERPARASSRGAGLGRPTPCRAAPEPRRAGRARRPRRRRRRAPRGRRGAAGARAARATIARDVGDRDLRGDGEPGAAARAARLVERGDEHGGRAAGEDDGVDRRRAGHRPPRRCEPARDRTHGGDGRRRRRRDRAARTSAGWRIGTCIPAANISIAKPIEAMNAVVGSLGSTQPNPDFPTTSPATSSPTTTGTSTRSLDENSGPTSPASTITVRIPKLTVPRRSCGPGGHAAESRRSARRPFGHVAVRRDRGQSPVASAADMSRGEIPCNRRLLALFGRCLAGTRLGTVPRRVSGSRGR